MNVPGRDRLAFAADLPLEDAVRVYRQVQPWVGCAKVGLSLFVEHGPAAVTRFLELGAKVFLDLKLHDIPNTVELASFQAAQLGVSWLTIHALGGRAMLQAALKGVAAGAAKARVPPATVLAVTILTSLNDQDLGNVGFREPVEASVLRLAELALSAGVPGWCVRPGKWVVCTRGFPMHFCARLEFDPPAPRSGTKHAPSPLRWRSEAAPTCWFWAARSTKTRIRLPWPNRFTDNFRPSDTPVLLALPS